MHLKKITALCTSALLALGLGVVGVTAAQAATPLVGTVGSIEPWTSDMNQTSYWEARFSEHQATCYKDTHGSITDNGKTVTLPTFNQDWPGDHWEALIIKGGSVSVNVVSHPSAGVAYASPLNDGGNQSDVSWRIACKGTTPEDEPEEPITVRVNLTYIMDCPVDTANTWRVRNPSDKTITVTWRNASNTLSGTHTATPGDTFFETPRGSETMIISWGGGDTGIVAGSVTKASGNDVAASDPKCKPDDKVEYGDWVVGEYDCDDTTVTETREVYTTTYSLVDGKWTGNTVTTSESRERALTAEEIDALFCPDPEPETKVEYGEWVTGEYDCDDTQVTETRTVTTTTYTLVGEKWVANDPQITQETRVRDLTEQEIDELFCPGPQPEDKVVTSEWVDGTYDCGDTRVEQTRTVTTTPYVLEGETWVEGESTSVTETQTRDLTPAELLALDCPDNLAQTGPGEWIGGALLAALLMLGLGAVPVARAIRNKA